MSVLLGIDVPELSELLQDEKTEDVFAVTTRAGEKKQREEAETYQRREKACGVKFHPTAPEEEETWGSDMDESLFLGGKERVKKSRKEKRAEKTRRAELQSIVEENEENEEEFDRDVIEKHELDISARGLASYYV